MKKMITFAIMALLIGGFAINVDAQVKTENPTSSNNNNSNLSQKIDQWLSDFNATIGKCEETDQKLQKVEKQLKDIAKIEKNQRRLGTYQTSNKTKHTKESLQKERKVLQNKYREQYRYADNLNDQLSHAKKSMSSNQKSQFESLESRFDDLPTPTTK